MFKSIALHPIRSYPVADSAAVEWSCTSIAPGKHGGPDCQMNFTGVDVSEPVCSGPVRQPLLSGSCFPMCAGVSYHAEREAHRQHDRIFRLQHPRRPADAVPMIAMRRANVEQLIAHLALDT